MNNLYQARIPNPRLALLWAVIAVGCSACAQTSSTIEEPKSYGAGVSEQELSDETTLPEDTAPMPGIESDPVTTPMLELGGLK